MTPDLAKRPLQVTIGGSLAAVGGLLLVFGLYETLGATQSAELRRQLAETLAEPPASGLGLEVDQALSLMRGLITVLAVAGGLSVVLGVFTVLGDGRARWGLLACAIVVFVGSPVAGAGLLGLGVTLGTILVFSPPARDWFAGRPIRPRPEPRGRTSTGGASGSGASGDPKAPQDPSAPARGGTGGSSVFVSRGAPGGATVSAAPDQQQAGSATPGASGASPVWGPDGQGSPASGRPRAVSEACVATWIGSLVAALLCGVMLLLGLVARDVLEQQLAEQPELETVGLSAASAVDGVLIAAAVALVWAVAAALLALATWRGAGTAQTLLVVSAVLSIVAGLLALPLGLVNAGLAAFVVARLLRKDARAWTSSR